MNFELFAKMSPEEAADTLSTFIRTGSRLCQSVIEDADFSLETLAFRMERIVTQLEVTPTLPDPNIPEFIRSTADYKNSLFEFTSDSKGKIIACAYYFGECFVRSYSHLVWAVGNVEFATGNMPVVSGFSFQQELPVMLVVENMFSRYVRKTTSIGDFAKAISKWREDAEPN
jgi:hypothetical protein